MSDPQKRIFDEFAKLFTDAASVAQGVQKEATTMLRSQAERFINEMNLVTREDFEAVKEMAAKARAENEALEKRIHALEEALAKPAKRTKPASGD